MKINENTKTIDVLLEMSEGNLSAAKILSELVKTRYGSSAMLDLNDLKIYGDKIVSLYKSCKEDLHDMIIVLMSTKNNIITEMELQNVINGNENFVIHKLIRQLRKMEEKTL